MDGPNVSPVKVKREEIAGGKASRTVFGVRSVGKGGRIPWGNREEWLYKGERASRQLREQK